MSRQALELEGWEECGIWGGDGQPPPTSRSLSRNDDPAQDEDASTILLPGRPSWMRDAANGANVRLLG